MATRSDVLRLRIDLEGKEAEALMKRFTGTVTRSNQRIRRSNLQGAKGFAAVATSIRTLVPAFLAAVGAAAALRLAFRALSGVAKASVKSAATYESSVVSLAVALANQGRNTAAARKDLLEYAETLQTVSVATENQIITALAQAVSLGASSEAAKDLARAATDLSAQTGRDLESSFRALNVTLGGTSGELGEIVPGVKKLTEEQRIAGKAAEVVLKQFKGAGEEGAKTFEGSVNNLNSALDITRREIGGPLKDALKALINEALLPAIRGLNKNKDAFQDFRLAIAETGIVLSVFGGAFESFVRSPAFRTILALGLAKAVKELENLQTAMAIAGAGVRFQLGQILLGLGGLGESPLFDKLREQFEALKEAADLGEGIEGGGFKDAGDSVSALDKALKALGVQTVPEVNKQIRLVNEATLLLEQSGLRASNPEQYERLHDELNKIAETLGIVANVLPTTFLEINTAISAFVQGGMAELNQALKDANAEGIEPLGESIDRNLRGLGVSAAQQFGDALVRAAIEGGVSFKKFFKALLADLARAILQATILQAILAGSGGGGIGSAIAGGGGFGGFALPIPFTGRKGGIVGHPEGFTPAQAGVLIRGGIPGRDSVPILAQQGESVLPRALTQHLMGAARASQRAASDSGLTTEQSPTTSTPSLNADLGAPSTIEMHFHGVLGAKDAEAQLRQLLEDHPTAFAAGSRAARRRRA